MLNDFPHLFGDSDAYGVQQLGSGACVGHGLCPQPAPRGRLSQAFPFPQGLHVRAWFWFLVFLALRLRENG